MGLFDDFEPEEPGEELREKMEESARRCPKQAITIEG